MSNLSFYCQISSIVQEILGPCELLRKKKAMPHPELRSCIKKTIITTFNGRMKTAEFYL